LIVPKAFPIEFRRDVVAVARKGEASLAQIAKDFGISESCLQRWLKLADIEDGVRPGVTASESVELRELRKRNRLLEQENEILRRAAAYFASRACPVLGSSKIFVAGDRFRWAVGSGGCAGVGVGVRRVRTFAA
jgi:transposase